MIKVVDNEEFVNEHDNQVNNIRNIYFGSTRITYLNFKEAFELSDDEIRELFIEALGEELGRRLFDIGSNSDYDSEAEKTFKTAIEGSKILSEMDADF